MTSSDQASKLAKLLALARDLGPASDTDKFLKRLTVAAAELTDSEAGSILKFDETSNALRFVAAPWVSQDVIEEITVPIDDSMAGWSFGNTEALVIKDVSRDSRHFKAVDRATKFTTTSLLAVPMIYQGNTIGVLEVVNKKNRAHYTEDDVTILEMLALYASMALWNSATTSSKEKQDEFSELDRMKGNFIAITSHELRTPLGLILGHATFLKELIGDEFQEPMDIIIRNATKLKDIVENLTNVGNYETGVASIRQGTVSIPFIIEDVASSFQDMAKSKNISLKTDVREKDIQVEADANKITVALSNLVRNAITFTNEGGNILISAETVTGHVQVSVKDDGVGIPPEDLSNVFERFFQVESHLTRHHSGMGLGLSVAKTMIELHGGRIWAESVQGKGSKFTFLLPLRPIQKQTATPAFIS